MKSQTTQHIAILLIVTLFAIGAVGCSGQSLIGEDAIVDTSLGTVNSTANKALAVSLRQHGTPTEDSLFPNLLNDDGSKTFQNNLGITITLTQAALSYGHMHLISEGDDAECVSGDVQDYDLFSIQNLMALDLSPIVVANQLIEDIAFCQYELHLTADNSESSGLDSIPEIFGHSVILSGDWSFAGSGDSFSITIDDDIEILNLFLALDDAEGVVAHPLHFHDGETGQALGFSVLYDRFFDDVTFAENESDRLDLIKQNVAQSIQQTLDQDASFYQENSSESSDHFADGHTH